ncbi:MAG: hypothetical protein HONDAALG_03770 [Gammaproteobacteria bacterium]|nr:hypothetical protein [Gammaproteobacteria bacterium]
MAISWKVDELRSTVQAQMAQIDRLDVVIDELSARAEAAEAEVARLRDSEIDAKVWKNRVDEAAGVINSLEAQLAAVRQALGGSENSDLVLLATKISEALSASERELEQARDYVDDAIGCANPIVPLVERIGLLVSMLAAGSTTTPAELDAVVDKCTVDALARRVEELEIAIQADVRDRLADRQQIAALTRTVTNLRRLAQQTHGLEAGL